MRIGIIYDSFFGNTEKIAEIMVQEGNKTHQVYIQKVKEQGQNVVEDFDFLVVGSPTRAFRATKGIRRFLKNLPPDVSFQIAIFDTRMDVNKHPSKLLRFLAEKKGYACDEMQKILRKKGIALAKEPICFMVEDAEGPLSQGEAQRARDWMASLSGMGEETEKNS